MSEENKQKLKEYQKSYLEAKKSKQFLMCKCDDDK